MYSILISVNSFFFFVYTDEHWNIIYVCISKIAN